MAKTLSCLISEELSISEKQVKSTLNLLEDGCSVPFISRYRKEATGSLNEVVILQISDLKEKYEELDKRKNTILSVIDSQGKLTDELRNRILNTWDSLELEDIYAPYKLKKHTRAEIARQKGLEPLAAFLFRQSYEDVYKKASLFVDSKKGVQDESDAIKGAQDIIAEKINENESARNIVRKNFSYDAEISSKVIKGKEEAADKYKDYFNFKEKLSKCASHRLLAMRRGEAEGLLRVSISGDDELCLERIVRRFVKNDSDSAKLIKEAVEDSYKRLLKPSIETEYANSSKEKADDEAIRIFVKNLEQLLMFPPLGPKRVLAIDPGFRTGCKVVCLSSEGDLLHHDVIFPNPPQNESVKAGDKILSLITRYEIEAISIGNGTASRETEQFVRNLNIPSNVQIFIVSEDGASIYSASKIAREEFPDYDVTVRGAVSIGRRLMDPLAELVKIDPDSIGVGQYQKDVNSSKLKKSLDHTVVSCVNKVGVNLNTASSHLLSYISGLGPALAQNIVKYRLEHGAFTSRQQLLKVSKLGPKAFEQCAGFLRIDGGANPLDNSAVHPESYCIVERMAKDLHCSVNELIGNKEKCALINLHQYVSERVGEPTLKDIKEELEKPGRDPRSELKLFEFSKEVKSLEDVKAGMVLPGIVTNITDFGCFVDVGVHTKGLVHISELADRYVKDPTQVVSLQQNVYVKVLSVDVPRQRLSLSMKGLSEQS